MDKLMIGITDCSKFDNYSRWILSYASSVEVIRLSEKTNNLEDLNRCHALLLSGGEDVHPELYGKPEYLSYCHATDINLRRDLFELQLMQKAEEKALPVLGICRGLQIYNVFKKGTLIPDIPSFRKFNHAKHPDDKDRYHEVQLDPHSVLYTQIIKEQKGSINSNHHQSADLIGSGLVVSALSPDGVVEALERKNPEEDKTKGALLLVQWHPERMNPGHSPFVENIRHWFFRVAQQYQK